MSMEIVIFSYKVFHPALFKYGILVLRYCSSVTDVGVGFKLPYVFGKLIFIHV